jgi:hypothetical protein
MLSGVTLTFILPVKSTALTKLMPPSTNLVMRNPIGRFRCWVSNLEGWRKIRLEKSEGKIDMFQACGLRINVIN